MISRCQLHSDFELLKNIDFRKSDIQKTNRLSVYPTLNAVISVSETIGG